jgi:mycofactocin biosynthesis protein MftB
MPVADPHNEQLVADPVIDRPVADSAINRPTVDSAVDRPVADPVIDRPGTDSAFDNDRPWALNPQVALRPESFGALAYHFGTRRLSFLKSRTLLCVVESLADQPTGTDACRAAGVSDEELPAYEKALAALAASGMICEREAV